MRYKDLGSSLSKNKIFVFGSILALCAASAGAEPQKTTTAPSGKQHSISSKHSAKGHRRGKSKKGAWKRHGQQSMQPDRILAIQQALIREKYLSGEPSGAWDTSPRTQ